MILMLIAGSTLKNRYNYGAMKMGIIKEDNSGINSLTHQAKVVISIVTHMSIMELRS